MFHAATTSLMPPLLVPASIAASAIVLLVASFNDIASRTLPNWTSLTLAMIGAVLRAADATLLPALAAAALVFGLLVACWRRGWLGGGDVKLLAACTLLVPPGQVLNLVLATAIAGGVLSAIYLVLGRLDLGSAPATGLPGNLAPNLARRIWRIECWRISRRGPLPYGCAIASGAMFMLLAPPGLFAT